MFEKTGIILEKYYTKWKHKNKIQFVYSKGHGSSTQIISTELLGDKIGHLHSKAAVSWHTFQ